MYTLLLDYLNGKLNKKLFYLRAAKLWLKWAYSAPCARATRIVFLGKRAKAKHNRWLHHNNHPWEQE